MAAMPELRMNTAPGRIAAHRFAGWLGGVLITLSPIAQAGQDDAERMARLLSGTAYRPSASELRRRYVDAGSSALVAFLARDDADAHDLAAAVGARRGEYRRAVARCLPAARALTPRLPEILRGLAGSLGRRAVPSVHFVFGDGRSAGTVVAGDVVLALEVVCRFDGPNADMAELLEAFVLHEAVHFYQLRAQRPGLADSLLRQAMIEGFADLVAGERLGRALPQEAERARYGRRHEARLWSEFRRGMDGQSLGHWMYGPGRDGEPPDLGYWIGKRISAAYLAASSDRDTALQELLELVSPRDLLQASGYPGAEGD